MRERERPRDDDDDDDDDDYDDDDDDDALFSCKKQTKRDSVVCVIKDFDKGYILYQSRGRPYLCYLAWNKQQEALTST